MKVLSIVWIDTVSSGDQWVDEIPDPATIHTVGILLKEEESYIALALSVSEDGLVRGYVCIPKTCIVETEVLLDDN